MLSQMSLRSCNIKGDVPGWISTRKDLDILDLSNNIQLTGRFPQWLARWMLEVYYCQITTLLVEFLLAYLNLKFIIIGSLKKRF